MKNPVYYTLLKTPLGKLGIFATPNGVCGLSFQESGFHRHFQRTATLFGTTPIKNDLKLQETSHEVARYFTGRSTGIRAPVDIHGLTPFQCRVLKLLQQIPFGTVQSYQWVAQKIHKPGASRAVGGACAVNPVPILIPCHRVIAKNGSLGGYSAGISIKQWLLNHERGI